MDVKSNRWSKIRSIERRIRTNIIYTQWVKRNKSWACYGCNRKENLELHHITELYHIILGTIKTFNTKDAIEHILSRHKNDEVDCLTLCHLCHGNIHPNIESNNQEEININETFNFVVFPRKFDFDFQQGKKNQNDNKVNLICLQVLFGFGYYILNKGLIENLLDIDVRDFARKLGKTPGTSFNKSLKNSLDVLSNLKILESYQLSGRDLSVCISEDYLEKIEDNPWFIPLYEVQTKKMSILTLKWFLSFQNKKVYKISKEKICSHLCLTTTTPAYVKNTILNASKDIRWVKSSYSNNIFKFEICKNKGVPVYKLRNILNNRLLYRT